ncbi:recombinase family protein [Streptomyces sp. NPDC058092]|uniref:recombinase family protein n=1 Tax=Streptomyces sp. NPDC058092 TaxID=3346336 RepID=UPI0036EBC2BB
MINEVGTVSGTDTYCACYIRQSRKKANKSEASPEDQRDKTRAWVDGEGHAFVDYYEDIGKSGYDPNAERKGFDRMMNDARSGKINMIVVHYASRFSRQNYNVVLMQMLELFNLGVRVVSVNEGEFSNNNVMDLMNIVMRFEAGHNESRNKSIAVRGTFEKARAQGGWLGGHAPFGFSVEKELRNGIPVQILRPRDDESETIQWAWHTIKSNMDIHTAPHAKHPASLAGLVDHMNGNGMKTRAARIGGTQKDARWTVTTFTRILRDPRLAGYQAIPNTRGVEQPEGVNRWKYRIQRDENGQPLMYDYEPVIPRAEWWELQAWLDTRGRGRGLSRGQSLLSALRNANDEPVLYCDCHKPMCSYAGTSPKPQYRCNFRNVPEHVGGNSMVQAHLDEHIGRVVFGRILTAEGDGDTAGFLLEATKRYARTQEAPSNLRERRQLVMERAEAAQLLKECEADYKSVKDAGPATRRAVLEEMDRAETALAALDARLRALAEADSPALPIAQWINAEDGNGDPMGEGSWWATASLADRRQFVALFVDRIVIHKTHLRGNKWKQYDAAERLTITFAGDEPNPREAPQAA